MDNVDVIVLSLTNCVRCYISFFCFAAVFIIAVHHSCSASVVVLCPLLLAGSAGHSSWLYAIVLVGDCCLVVGWVCLVGVGVALWSVSF